ncbi:putative Actin [Paratrimastix pyriformis]|uniref:Actin n=1 Tax=Paratrimastix pyriformis TaxID=342808 RepID=A0ABQ8U651_9EUKA|nr:putative Actin [Paratrimastix pyriformis]
MEERVVKTDSVVVIDNGGDSLKIGYEGEVHPHTEFSNAVGRMKVRPVDAGTGADKEYHIGGNITRNDELTLTFPVEYGMVVDWDDMEKVFRHAFVDELRIATEANPVLLTEAPLTPRYHREKMVQLMFENLEVPALYLLQSPVAALFANGDRGFVMSQHTCRTVLPDRPHDGPHDGAWSCGDLCDVSRCRTTGLVMDSGDGATHFVPVYEGTPLHGGIMRLDLGGRDLTDYFARLVAQRGYPFRFGPLMERAIMRDMKERMCFCSLDYQHDRARSRMQPSKYERPYELPDKARIDAAAAAPTLFNVGPERFYVPEAMFSPKKLHIESKGIHKLIRKSILRCDGDIRKELFANVILSGGNTMFKWLPERLQTALDGLDPTGIMRPKVDGRKERKSSAWIGASILAQHSIFRKMITREEYDETGPSIVDLKCF